MGTQATLGALWGMRSKVTSATLPDGWLTDPEADELRRLSKNLVVLELGAWKGRSTVVLSENAHTVISVDRHRGIFDEGDTFPEYWQNVRNLPNMVAVVCSFGQIVPFLRDVDMVYIDGDHEAEPVKRDIGLALLTGARLLAFHDWDFFEVRETALEELAREPDKVVGSVASYQLK